MKIFLFALLSILIFSSCNKGFVNNENENALTVTDESNITSNSQIQGQTPVFANICASVKGYTIKLPNDYSTTTKKKYPLLVYLHGLGVCGNGTTQLYKVTKNGVSELLQTGKFPEKFTVNGKSYKFIVVTPQFNNPYMYSHDIKAVIDYIKNNYRTDATRVYLTGMSLGGGATVNFCDSFATTLAAAVPMASCWPPPFESIANSAVSSKLPMWFFHNRYDKDTTTPPSNSIDLVSLINSYSPAIPAKITLFNSTSHDCWTKGYSTGYKENNMNIYQWMLQYVRKP
ncbi:MAG: alpha/beta hydrolase-fold protein [Ilyomonas sp.]